MTARSPIVFGSYLDDIDFERWMSDFDTEMHRYRRGHYGEKGSNLDILHVSADLEAASDEMAKITGFLEPRGFSDERIPKLKDWPDADLLIIGSDERHSEHAVNMVDYLPSVFGIVTSLDVLLYGLHGRIETGLAPVDRPLLAGKSFGLDGICLAHSHMRRWTDNIMIKLGTNFCV